MKNLKIIIITGLSGSGKSEALAAFEDAGYYCVDNMPVALLPKFLELPTKRSPEIAGLVFVMDLRETNFLSRYPGVFQHLRQLGYDFDVLFLEADDETLLRRFSQTRRHHPLSQGKSLLDDIRTEREQLKDLRVAAAKVIDTSTYNVHEFKTVIRDIARKNQTRAPMRIHIQSFGFKFGLPLDADLVVDVRFLANPYFVPALKPLDGETDAVRDYVSKGPETRAFLAKYLELLDYLLPLYEKEGKSYITIAVGCTGGRHRSVVIARALYEHIAESGKQVEILHRDIANP
ncbi:MAG: RNase adapter RapZ [Desulfobacterales bacterium]|nr:RNase adapter RapZ [Desulfobacterales bacterium]